MISAAIFGGTIALLSPSMRKTAKRLKLIDAFPAGNYELVFVAKDSITLIRGIERIPILRSDIRSVYIDEEKSRHTILGTKKTFIRLNFLRRAKTIPFAKKDREKELEIIFKGRNSRELAEFALTKFNEYIVHSNETTTG